MTEQTASMLEHLKHMAEVRPEGLDRQAAEWAVKEIARLEDMVSWMNPEDKYFRKVCIDTMEQIYGKKNHD